MLADKQWKLKYTRDDGDLVRLFYVPALQDAERYDRLTGYFSAEALVLAARGIDGWCATAEPCAWSSDALWMLPRPRRSARARSCAS